MAKNEMAVESYGPYSKVAFKMLILFLSIISMMVVFTFFYLRQPQFAQLPDEISFENRNLVSSYDAGVFQNQVETPVLTSNQSRIASMTQFLFGKDHNSIPTAPLPSVKTDLHKLNKSENAVVWMGHSSYYIQLDGIRFLIDPVFSDNASPVPATNQAFPGSNIYTVDDIPEIDYLITTHDHWDHLDYATVTGLKSKIKNVITPLGVGSYFEQWGFAKNIIQEGDWRSVIKRQNGLEIHILPARHFSGRLLTRNKTLWSSFALVTPRHKIYVGGDSGYGPHFKEIGKQFGRFDLAILECGQYNENWRFIHMMPEETAQAGEDLNASAVLPSHNSKFKLAHHAWNDPLIRISEASKGKSYRLLTPMIGELVQSDNPAQRFSQWFR